VTIYSFADGAFRSIGSTDVNVQSYGATGDGATDDTAAINAAIAAAVSGGIRTVIIPDGTYMIRADDPQGDLRQQTWLFQAGIQMLSGVHLKLSQGATLKAFPSAGDHGYYKIISCYGVDNIEISGGTVVGERATHTGTAGQWGHGISLMGCADVSIHDMTLIDCWGDGINVLPGGGDSVADPPCRRVSIRRVVCDNNRRQGLSISGVIDMAVEDSTFSNTNGHEPQCGLDIESNGGTRPTKDITVERCRFEGNRGAGFTIVHGDPDRITVRDCRFEGNDCVAPYVGQVWVKLNDNSRSYKVLDNWFGPPGATGGTYNIFLEGGRNVEVSGNVMTGAPMHVQEVSESRIVGNVIGGVSATEAAVTVNASTPNLAIEGNRIIGGSVGVALTGGTIDRATLAYNRISGAAGAAISVATDTSNIIIEGNSGWSNGAGVFFDTAKTHTAHSIDTAHMDGTDTLPA
jgi:hypothetical protein